MCCGNRSSMQPEDKDFCPKKNQNSKKKSEKSCNKLLSYNCHTHIYAFFGFAFFSYIHIRF